MAFAKQEHLAISPYVPTHAEQSSSSSRFYADYYSKGPGKSHPDAPPAPPTLEPARFNQETQILPLPSDPIGAPNPPITNGHAEPTTNHTVDPQTFVTTLCGAITRNHMESAIDLPSSFDYRTLILVE